MKNRINLFNELTTKKKNPITFSKPQLKFKFGFRVNACIVTTGLFLFMVVPKYRELGQTKIDVVNRIAEINREVDVLMKKAEEQIRVNQERSKNSKTAKKVEVFTNGTSPGIDASWSSVLWKFSTFTKNGVILKKMELNQSATAPEGMKDRKVTIDGQAASLPELREWIESLSENISSSDLVMDRQSYNAGSDFPVEFKVTVRLL